MGNLRELANRVIGQAVADATMYRPPAPPFPDVDQATRDRLMGAWAGFLQREQPVARSFLLGEDGTAPLLDHWCTLAGRTPGTIEKWARRQGW